MESVRGIKLNAITDKKMMVGQLSSHGSEGGCYISRRNIIYPMCMYSRICHRVCFGKGE